MNGFARYFHLSWLAMVLAMVIFPVDHTAGANPMLSITKAGLSNDTLSVDYQLTLDPSLYQNNNYSMVLRFTIKIDNQFNQVVPKLLQVSEPPADGTIRQTANFTIPGISSAKTVRIDPVFVQSRGMDGNNVYTLKGNSKTFQIEKLKQAPPPNEAPAVDQADEEPFNPDLGFSDFKKELPLPRSDFVAQLFNFLNLFWAVTFLITIMISGIMFITARDNPEKVKKAATYLAWLVIGLILFILFFWIFGIVRDIVVDLLICSNLTDTIPEGCFNPDSLPSQ